MSQTQKNLAGLLAGNRRLWMIAGLLAGIVLVSIAVVYFTTPANSLPFFFPGYSSSVFRVHWKHGLLALILGAGAFILAWFNSGSAQQK
jgi:hypothetical protein